MIGEGEGAGYTANIAWDGPGAGDAEYMEAMDEVIVPLGRRFCPQVMMEVVAEAPQHE